MFLRAMPVEPPNILLGRVMRHSNKIDRSVSLAVLFGFVLTVIGACVAPSGPLGAPNNLVNVPSVSSVQITLAKSTLAPGQTTQATVVATSADGKVVGGRVDYLSENPSIATVSSNGAVTAQAAGETVIQATVASRVALATVTVSPAVPPAAIVAVVAVALDSTSLTIGHTAKASATPKDSAGSVIAGQTVTWASLSPNIATVASTGIVTGVAAGSATIQGTVSVKFGSASLTILQGPPPAPSVSVVQVTVDSMTLLVGHLAHASATPKDAAGTPIAGLTVSWASLKPAVATVSSSGQVTAVAPGSALIQATVSGKVGTAPVTIISSSVLASHNFDDGTLGPYVDPWHSNLDIIADPTGAGKGKVARILYNPVSGGSSDRGLAWGTNGVDKLRYGRTIWFRGDLYLPTGTIGYNPSHNRKLIDYQGGGVRMTLHRVGPNNVVKMSIVDWMNGSEQEVMDANTGIVLNDNTWYTIEVRMTNNSSDNVRDGVLEIYINGSPMPSFQQTTGLGWITEKFAGGSYFDAYLIGFQLTIDAGAPVYTEYRYWDNVAFSFTRIGP